MSGKDLRMSNNIKFLKNGFELETKNNETIFIAYQGISIINGVKIGIIYGDLYDKISKAFIGDNVAKRCYFTIWMIDGKRITVSFKSGIRYFRRLSNELKNMSLIKKIIKGPNESGLDKESWFWLHHAEVDMEESVKELNDVRNTLIERFNEWKAEKN